MAESAQSFMAQSRPITPQVDLKNLLNVLGGALVNPQTSYAGLTAEQVNASAANTMDALAKQQALIQAAQQGAVNQEQAAFNDAMTANRLAMDSQQLDLQKASHALQAMVQQANLARAARQEEMARQEHALRVQQAQYEMARQQEAQKALEGFSFNYNGQQIPMSAIPALGQAASALIRPQATRAPTKAQMDLEANTNAWNSYGLSPEGVDMLSRFSPLAIYQSLQKHIDQQRKMTASGIISDEEKLRHATDFVNNALGIPREDAAKLVQAFMGQAPVPASEQGSEGKTRTPPEALQQFTDLLGRYTER